MACALVWSGGASALTVTVGQGAGCDFPSIAAALDGIGPEVSLELLVQGRDDDASQGIYDDGIDIAQGRSVRIRGDAGHGLSACSAAGSTRPPSIQGPTDRPLARYLVQIDDASELTVEDIDIRDSTRGGVLVTGGSTLNAHRVRFTGHRTTTGVSGAAISIDAADVLLEDAVFTDNQSPAAGGAIFCTAAAPDSARIRLAGAVVFGVGATGQGNRAGFDGGAIALHRRCALVDGPGVQVVFENNSAGRDGGAIAMASQVGAPGDASHVDIGRNAAGGSLIDNFAARNGGAMHVGSQNRLEIHGESWRFAGNTAAGDGGALAVQGPTLAAADERGLAVLSASFSGNSAQRGGAILVDGRDMALKGGCESRRLANRDRYCDEFSFNRADGSRTRFASGGAIHLTGGAVVEVDRYAFERNDVRAASGLAGRGSVAGVEGGSTLRLSNSLLVRNGHDDPLPDDATAEDTTALHLMGTPNHLDMTLSTVVEQRGTHYLRVQTGSSARLVGVIAALNPAGISDPGGGVSGTCNNAQLDAAPPPLDPGFVPAPGTARGKYRLGEPSLMRARCRLADLTPEEVPLDRDLDGAPRRITLDRGVEKLDIGAFAFNEPLQASGRCVDFAGTAGLQIDIERADTFEGVVRITGKGPGLPSDLDTFFPGPGSWTDVAVVELDGDMETLTLGSFACGLGDPVFSSGFE